MATKSLNSLHDLYVEQLKDLYSAETQLMDALPQMASAANDSDLKDAFNQHLQETRNQADRLQRIFNRLNEAPNGVTCKAMEGLVKEGQEVINMPGDPTVKDAALIAAAQRIEHYEIAGYGSVRTYADILGYGEDENFLQQTLNEEGNADDKLTNLAKGGMLSKGINQQAAR